MNKIKERKVLIVDDSKLMRLLLKNIVDGAEKLKKFRKWVKSIDERNYPNGGICYEKK